MPLLASIFLTRFLQNVSAATRDHPSGNVTAVDNAVGTGVGADVGGAGVGTGVSTGVGTGVGAGVSVVTGSGTYSIDDEIDMFRKSCFPTWSNVFPEQAFTFATGLLNEPPLISKVVNAF